MLALAGCGDDDESERQGADPAQATETSPPPAKTESTQTEPSEETRRDRRRSRREQQRDGGKDKQPARHQVALRASDGKITPRIVSVPPYVAIRLELRSSDGDTYRLACGQKTLTVDSEGAADSTTLSGRRPGARFLCSPLGDHNGVLISPSGEPEP
jgi:hypothetical protein